MEKIQGNIIKVKLKDGREIKGQLRAMDNFMNLELDDAVEYVDGEPSSRYGEVFLHGNNVLWIQIDSTFIDRSKE